MVTIISTLVIFTVVALMLTALIALAEYKLVNTGDVTIIINEDESKPMIVAAGTTLLNTLSGNGILLPSGVESELVSIEELFNTTNNDTLFRAYPNPFNNQVKIDVILSYSRNFHLKYQLRNLILLHPSKFSELDSRYVLNIVLIPNF